MTELENTALWKSFAKKANDQQRQLVRNLVEKSTSRLDLVRDTFPTYTLHNHVHAINVVKLMDKLLGSDVESISALEGAILILSAYLHDIGMVFTEEERHSIENEQEFGHFLEKFPEAFVVFKESGEVTPDLAERYCRWIHPQRVHHYLPKLDESEISWGHIPIDRNLGLVCESHGWDTSILKTNDQLKTDFLGQCDLLFCSIILRLADILDFDRSRSPEEVYKYLGVRKRDTKRTSLSDVEWQKHLCAAGFVFPEPQLRKQKYILKFIASPDHPVTPQ